MLKLKPSSKAWIECALANFNLFLLDHASAEKKASGMAINLISHYPDKPYLVQRMAELAIEELNHFKEVIKLIHERNLQLAADEKDNYVNAMLSQIRTGKEVYLIDRLLIAGIIEARGFERFGLIAEHLPEQENTLKSFYQTITRSEERHAEQFIELAQRYAKEVDVDKRCAELLEYESGIIDSLPVRPALH